MTEKTFVPADITPGTIALLSEIAPDILPTVFKELARRSDFASLKVLLNSDTVRSNPWKELRSDLLLLEGSTDPIAKEIYLTVMKTIPAYTAKEMALRLLHLAELNDRFPEVWTNTRSEIERLLSIGADVELPVGPGKRTPLGQAIKNSSMKTADFMLTESARRNPARLPHAAQGRDVVTFVISNGISEPFASMIMSRTCELYDFSRPELKAGPSKAVAKFLTDPQRPAFTNDVLARLLFPLAHNMVDRQTMRDLWNMAGCDRFFPDIPFFAHMAKASWSGLEQPTIDAFQGFVDAGIDINAPLSNGKRAIDHALRVGSETLLETVLNAGVDLDLLQAQVRSDPKYLDGVPEDRKAMAFAFMARARIANVTGLARRKQSNNRDESSPTLVRP